MNILMIDSGQLTGEAIFPDLNINKYGWQQFISLDASEVEERSWRTDVIVSTCTPVSAQIIEGACKLKLIVAAGDNTDHIDHDAARARGIHVVNVPGLTGNTAENTQTICEQVVQHINAWIERFSMQADTAG
ncbi:hypothetical protein MNBD_GAMMA11-319 [hydrothermal vent metagenome]|uniref:D-isomer specific 2-hydroxyacid dehydrogenase catalytic domain-containing protein n=1 Tax=hydrothermal vent metagenome TaxID=652676 RepID=A0A3B0XFZ8_9ZZZZ